MRYVLSPLLQRFLATTAGIASIFATLPAFAADPWHVDGMPPGARSEQPSLTLVSPVEGIDLESAGSTEVDLLTTLRWSFSINRAGNAPHRHGT